MDSRSPIKVVKKLRNDSGQAEIREWDVRGSPVASRRIVTRAGAKNGEEVIDGLEDEEESIPEVEEKAASTDLRLPDGFVSPMKPVKKAEVRRRRSMPCDFTFSGGDSTSATVEDEAVSVDDLVGDDSTSATVEDEAVSADDAVGEEDEWEDVDEEIAVSVETATDGQSIPTRPLSIRRSSSSPVQRKPHIETAPHIIAFSPIKLKPPPSPIIQPSESIEEKSPRKTKPRVSDDTALLQAFIKRADEIKNCGRVWTDDKVEPVSKGDVLADLDPNSPSPRKQVKQASSPTTNGSRRSLRNKPCNDLLPDTVYQPLPLNISIRASTDNVVLKKSEAQQLAALTRTHTRKNKSGAIPPKARLMKLASEVSSNLAPEEEDDTKRKVKWAARLASFYNGLTEEAESVASDAAEPVTENPKPERTSKRKSRLATPAKPRIRPDLALPIEEDPPVKEPERKKPPPSRLPAPVTSSSTALDLDDTTDMSISVMIPQRKTVEVTGLTSPAKRGRKVGLAVMGSHQVPRYPAAASRHHLTDANTPSLGSPAKKRSRRG